MPRQAPEKHIPNKAICAVMCNYARPKSARACVKRLKALGIREIIVWNNGSKPIREATKNIIVKKNQGPIGKYLAALQTRKPYVLIVDDDYLLTKAGLTALRWWSKKYPVVAQQGNIFLPPFINYLSRKAVFSEKIKTPQRVDMIMPNKGMLLKTSLYRKLPNHWAWKSQKVVRPGVFSTDLAVSCAIWNITRQRPLVVTTKGKGFVKLRDEAPRKALRNQKNIYQEKSKILKWLVGHGWKMKLDSKK